MSLEDEAPTTEENPEDLELAASEEVAATSSSPAMRLVSTVTEQHSYIYASGRLLRETITTTAADGTVTTEVLDFAYDAQGTPYSLTYTNGTASPATYYYITNLHGDVTYLIDSSGTRVASYSYDPYGQIQQTTGSMAEINPLRYRGYYYDADTEFYYLQSRYYDATICRFINADSYSSTGQGIIGYNMFAYCLNNPIMRTDLQGEFGALFGAIIGGGIVGGIIGAVSYAVSCGINGTEMTAEGMGSAIVSGVVNGAIGAASGIVDGLAVTGSIAVGVITAGVTAANAEGNFWQKAAIGFTAGVVAGVGTYIGTKIPTATENAFSAGFTSYCNTLMVGVPTEMVNVAAQKGVEACLTTNQSPASSCSATPNTQCANTSNSSKSSRTSSRGGSRGNNRVAMVM